MRRPQQILFGALLLLAVALVVALFTDFRADGLSRAVIEMAADRAGIELDVDRASLNLRRGLELEGVRGSTEAAGDSVTFRSERLVLEYRLAPLLRGEVVVERLLIEHPEVEVVSAAPSLTPERSEAAATSVESPEQASTAATARDGSSLSFSLGEVVVTEGRLISSSAASAGSTRLEGVDITLREVSREAERGPLLLALSGEGWLEVSSLRFDELSLENLAASLEVERGLYRVDAFDASSVAGRVRVEEAEIDLARSPYRYRLALRAAELDLERLLGLSPSLGRAALALRANGEGPGLAGAVAEMTLDLDAGTLPSVALFQRLDRVFGTALDGASYAPVSVEMSAAGGVVEIEPFRFVSSIASVEIGGTLGLDDEIDLSVVLGLPRAVLESEAVSPEVLDALGDGQQGLAIPLRLTGRLESPRIAPDVERLRGAARAAAGSARDALAERFRGEISGLVSRRLGSR